MTDFIDNNLNLRHSSSDFLVAILLCTYNGARFLAEQLNSLETQTHQNWVVIASDDGSTDQTLEILKQYQAKWPAGKLIVRSGPKKGFCHNFLTLATDFHIRADYYAFCDQDDVWLADKLTAALENIIKNQIIGIPYLYCGRTTYVNENLVVGGVSPLFVFPPSFRNALVQSIAGGNTMVFNHDAKILLERRAILNVISHDWWLYQIVVGTGGTTFYDPKPFILYRQHSQAIVGGNSTLTARIKRTIMLLKGRYRIWNDINIKALDEIEFMLTDGNREILRLFEAMRTAKFKDRLRLFQVCGIYRQTRKGTLSLMLALFINKI